MPARARPATSAMARLSPLIESWSTSRTAGHEQAVVDGDGDAHVDPPLGQDAGIGPVGVEGRVLLERLDRGLDHERDVAQRDALALLVAALGGLAGPHEPADVDLHVDVGVRDGQRPGHLRGDALAHLGHRQEDFVGAVGERDRRRRRAPRGWRRRSRGGRCRAAMTATGAGAAGPDGLDHGEDIVAGDPTAAAGALIWSGLRPCSRRSRRTAGVMRASGSPVAARVAAGASDADGGRGRLGGARCGRALVGAGRAGRRFRRGRARSSTWTGPVAAGASASSPGIDDRDLGVVGDRGALLGQDLLEDALERRRDLGVDLVRDDLERAARTWRHGRPAA